MNPAEKIDIQKFHERIVEELNKLDFKLEPVELYEPISYILSLGGKRMRPVLLMIACDMFDGNLDDALAPALAIEIFHNFTLMHDDIMDKALKRRNHPTVHTKWNENTAILSGDVMLVCAYQQLCKGEKEYLPQLLSLFNKTAIEVCEGQQFDMNYETRENVLIKDYTRMIELKTAVLLGCSLKTGAIIAGASENDQNNLYEFGRNIGIAFQLQDDILDVYGDSEEFGKQIGGDIVANKKTYLFLKAMELANAEQQNTLLKYFSSKTFDSSEKVKKVTGIYNQLNIREQASREMTGYLNIALAFLEKVNLPGLKKEPLRAFANQLMIRKS